MEPVVYTNLEGGTYHFMMVVQDTLGRDSKQVDVTIVKTKAFYEEAWFRLFVVLAAIGLVFGSIVFIVYKKTRALTKKNEQNRQFINEMTQAFAKTIAGNVSEFLKIMG